jgi:hypothetical protein
MSFKAPILQSRPDHLYHYTCDHARKSIGGAGHIVSSKDLLTTNVLETADEATRFITSVGWFTSHADIGRHNAALVGLDNVDLKCNRWEHRYRVVSRHTKLLVPWGMERLSWPDHIVTALEQWPGADALSWFVSTQPVPVVYDPIPASSSQKRGWSALAG